MTPFINGCGVSVCVCVLEVKAEVFNWKSKNKPEDGVIWRDEKII